MPVVWKIFEDYLWFIRMNYNIRIHSFLLMPNHFHLIASSPDGNLSVAMSYFMRESAKRMNELANTKNQIYGRPYFSSILGSSHYFMNTYKYVYQNPCRANLVNHPLKWKYSSLAGLLGFQSMMIPLENDTLIFSPDLDAQILKWLEILPDPEDLEAMRLALKRKEFKFSPSPANGRKISRLENQLL